MEASRICISRLPGQISDGFVSGVINSEDVDQISCLSLSSTNNVKSNLKPSVPAISCQFGTIICCGTIVELITQRWAISVGICYISKEKFAFGTDLKLEILKRVTVWGRNENLDNVFLPKRIITVLIICDNLFVHTDPVNIEILVIVAESSWGSVIRLSINVSEGKLGGIAWTARGNIDTQDYRAQQA